ncbi:MAG: hypothetical protein D3918_11875 [Candidatus Electrothrix sp. AX2]|nr:hypothetical protein [Candidatus Electrothrix gigas]
MKIIKSLLVRRKLRKVLIHRQKTIHQAELFCKQFNLNSFNRFSIDRYKSSDTLFILGSGGSIFNYTNELWKEIKEKDSFGFNHWYYHEHVPTFYMMEHRENGNPHSEVRKNLSLIASRYRNVAKFLKVKAGRPSSSSVMSAIPESFKKNIFHVNFYKLPVTHLVEYKMGLHELLTGSYRLALGFPTLEAQSRGSLDQIICFAVAASYKKIVLCGVDLTTTDYFYTHPDFSVTQEGLKVFPTRQTGKIHSTADSFCKNITIDQVVKCFRDMLLSEKQIKMYVALKSSGLYPMLPSYFE